MTRRELDAAGIREPGLRASYETCRRLNAQHGRTYFLATRLLPAHLRPSIHALYGFARAADEIVDAVEAQGDTDAMRQELDAFRVRTDDALSAGRSDDPVLAALAHTVARHGLPRAWFDAFLESMAMDLDVTAYDTYDDLLRYVHGSAEVIGWQVTAVVGTADGIPLDVALPYAGDLGVAFQLTNFVRDVGEDLRRGRVYLPLEDLELFGLTREDLERGVVDGRVRRLVAFEVARCRELYARAAQGVRLLHPHARDCVEVALRLYGGILDQVDADRGRVLDHRVRVPASRRARVAAPALARAVRARRTATPTRVALLTSAPRPFRGQASRGTEVL